MPPRINVTGIWNRPPFDGILHTHCIGQMLIVIHIQTIYGQYNCQHKCFLLRIRNVCRVVIPGGCGNALNDAYRCISLDDPVIAMICAPSAFPFPCSSSRSSPPFFAAIRRFLRTKKTTGNSDGLVRYDDPFTIHWHEKGRFFLASKIFSVFFFVDFIRSPSSLMGLAKASYCSAILSIRFFTALGVL